MSLFFKGGVQKEEFKLDGWKNNVLNITKMDTDVAAFGLAMLMYSCVAGRKKNDPDSQLT